MYCNFFCNIKIKNNMNRILIYVWIERKGRKENNCCREVFSSDLIYLWINIVIEIKRYFWSFGMKINIVISFYFCMKDFV